MRTLFVALALVAALAPVSAQQPATPPQVTLDFEYFRTKVQPIFLHKRPNLARCYVCHSQGTPLVIQSLSPGQTMWNEEQSRKNFEVIRRVVVPGNPRGSLLLMMPLAPEAGGGLFHPGGKHWTSQNDPEWRILADWVGGAK
ncbi:MAG: hypothetical protein HOP16_18380 [Acidobacteria bacterium]|nr:hypothetical protein [Acidobacteriota bacterium]